MLGSAKLCLSLKTIVLSLYSDKICATGNSQLNFHSQECSDAHIKLFTPSTIAKDGYSQTTTPYDSRFHKICRNHSSKGGGRGMKLAALSQPSQKTFWLRKQKGKDSDGWLCMKDYRTIGSIAFLVARYVLRKLIPQSWRFHCWISLY